MTKEEVRKAIEDYFAEPSTSKEDMEELGALINGLVEHHDWSVDQKIQISHRLITDFGFSTRVRHCLSCAADYYDGELPEVKTVGDLLKWKSGQLLRLPNFGGVSLKEVERFLARWGLKLDD